MKLIENQEIKPILSRLKISMLGYMDQAKPSYNSDDVDKCIQIIIQFLEEMDLATENEEIKLSLKNTVLALNELNEKCEFELIETGEREDIAEILITAGFIKGFNQRDEDITEEWRDW